MIDETFNKIEARLAGAKGMDPKRRQDLQELLGSLKAEVSELAKTHPEHSESIAGFVDLSTHEATRSDEKKGHLLNPALDGLKATVVGFEQEHPKVADAINRISVLLANMGI